MRKSLLELEQEISARLYWDADLLKELAWHADMEAEWDAADGENFEVLAYQMAEKVGIRLA